jgi:hypothetical protein
MLPATAPHHRTERRQLNHQLPSGPGAVSELRPRYLTIEAACRYAGIGRSKFYACLLRRVRTLRLGTRNLVELDSLDELLDQLASQQATAERAVS